MEVSELTKKNERILVFKHRTMKTVRGMEAKLHVQTPFSGARSVRYPLTSRVQMRPKPLLDLVANRKIPVPDVNRTPVIQFVVSQLRALC
jgi:hypothetical protein